ncbi:NAD-dependent epimerase/dehydratase family protein [Streptoalloteichus hindustanus]|uniref:Nucleoside-diphosphate-sugar epimerase n=1 Tax=Streptoalloteichus hindustanus TaxID=2017 RepID=A0A1M5PMR1_STRHI|nr:NAD-dependent epimerase/dehydratase family protein [Streptoalloteichus hindustanus]SHH03027.1 Nucleoside-diphosphate-sugar epimerase [Streptoalloteichus hindustanus]
MTRFLVTGATGFVGRRLVRHLVGRGHDVTALVRPTSRRDDLAELTELTDHSAPGHPGGRGVRLVEGDLVTGAGLAEATRGAECVVHLAGVTRSVDAVGFFRGNGTATRRLAAALAELPAPPRLVHCSSLAAAGPSTPGRPRDESRPPEPVSAYGRSKLAGEQAVRSVADRVWASIVRPPIVYGPGDRQFLPTLAAFVRRGLLPRVGPRGPRLHSLIHVDDLCVALLAAAERGARLRGDDRAEGVYFVSDGVEHRLADVGAAVGRALGLAAPRVVPVPGPVARAAALGAEWVQRARGRPAVITVDTAREAACPAWTCSPARARCELGFTAAVDLASGLADALGGDGVR